MIGANGFDHGRETLGSLHPAFILVQRDVANAPDEKAKLRALEDGTNQVAALIERGELAKPDATDALIAVARNNGLCVSARGREDVEHLVGVGLSGRRAMGGPVAPVAPKPAPRRQLISRCASDFQPEKVEWVWPGRAGVGKLTLIGGKPGLGKSQITSFLAAVVSTGGQWPCGEGSTPAGKVVIFSAEDGIEDTIVPRLIGVGADRDNIEIVSGVLDEHGRKTFDLKADVDLLEAKVREIGNVRLIIVDPISAYMGNAETNDNSKTRAALEPLAEMAARLRVAVVAVTHLNKGSAGGQSALERFQGSIAFVAAARAAFVVIEDEEQDGHVLFLQVKNNLAPKQKGLGFRLEQRTIDGHDIVASYVVWDGEHVAHTADEALNASETREGGDRTGKAEVVEFLRDALAAGPVDVLDIEQQARTAGLLGDSQRLKQSKPFRAAREEIGVVSDREGFGAGAKYRLRMPDHPCAPSKPIGALPENTAPMDIEGAHGRLEGDL
jgi:hypothetical protein